MQIQVIREFGKLFPAGSVRKYHQKNRKFYERSADKKSGNSIQNREFTRAPLTKQNLRELRSQNKRALLIKNRELRSQKIPRAPLAKQKSTAQNRKAERCSYNINHIKKRNTRSTPVLQNKLANNQFTLMPFSGINKTLLLEIAMDNCEPKMLSPISLTQKGGGLFGFCDADKN